MKPIFHIVHQRTGWDCSIATLASWLNQPYEEVLRVAARMYRVEQGLYAGQMVRVAKKFDMPLKRRVKGIDLEEHEGILGVEYKDPHAVHVVLLFNGFIFDPQEQGTIWDAQVYLATFNGIVIDLLEEA